MLAQPGLPGRIILPKIGDTTEVTVTVTEKRHDKRIIKLRTTAPSQRGEMVIDGTAVVKKVPLREVMGMFGPDPIENQIEKSLLEVSEWVRGIAELTKPHDVVLV